MLTKMNFTFLQFDTIVNDLYDKVYNKIRINCEYILVFESLLCLCIHS